MELNINKADILNFITSMEYLKNHLEAVDVSDDFSPDPDTSVSAWGLLVDSPVYSAFLAAAK